MVVSSMIFQIKIKFILLSQKFLKKDFQSGSENHQMMDYESMPHDSPLTGGYTHGSDEGSK